MREYIREISELFTRRRSFHFYQYNISVSPPRTFYVLVTKDFDFNSNDIILLRKDPMNFNSALLPCLKTDCELGNFL